MNRKEYLKAYRQAHKEKAKEYMKAYHQAYYQDNKEKVKAKVKAYQKVHKEEGRIRKRQKYCINLEEVENYSLAKADNFIGWDIHHRLETHNSDGERRLVDLTIDELKALGMYYNRPASELIFMPHKEHISLHKKGK